MMLDSLKHDNHPGSIGVGESGIEFPLSKEIFDLKTYLYPLDDVPIPLVSFKSQL